MWCRINIVYIVLIEVYWLCITLYHYTAKTDMLKGNMKENLLFRDSLMSIHWGLPLRLEAQQLCLIFPNHSSHQEQREETTVRKQSTELLSQPPESACCHPHLRSVRDTIPQIPTPSSSAESSQPVLVQRKQSMRMSSDPTSRRY